MKVKGNLEDKKMAKEIGTVEEALQDLRDGKVILVIDDPERENEGDLICAAEFATQENVNFMACEAKGLICMPMSGELCDKLGLDQMVSVNTDNHCTAFTVFHRSCRHHNRHFRSRAFLHCIEMCGRRCKTGRLPQTGSYVPTACKRRRRTGA